MIFVPKIKFQRELCHDAASDKLPQTRISGLDSAAAAVPPSDLSTESFNDIGSLNIENNGLRRSSGEQILTSKSPQELVKEVNYLKYMIVNERKTVKNQATEIAELRSLLETNGISHPQDGSSRQFVPLKDEKSSAPPDGKTESYDDLNKTDESCGS